MTQRWSIALALTMLLASVAARADISGTWRAEFNSPDGQARVNTFTFHVEGEKLTGTVAGSQDKTALEDGKVSGDDISFTAQRPFGKFLYKGKVAGSEIKFTVDFDGNKFEMTAKRVSQ